MDSSKTAIITGSATGVGAATALMLAQRGWNVCINYSKSEREARDTQAKCGHSSTGGGATLLVQADVADDADCRRLVASTIERWGRLDALVNNAGVTKFAGAGDWDTLGPEDFARILGVNVLGTFQMTRAAVPHLKASGSGAIVNVSSVAGTQGTGSSVPYVASKGGVNSMTLHFARVLAPEVRVNAVCPAMITSRWFVDGVGQEAYEKTKAIYEQSVPLGLALSPEDVAEAVVWLIGARTITGELVQLDSGMHLGKPRPPVRVTGATR